MERARAFHVIKKQCWNRVVTKAARGRIHAPNQQEGQAKKGRNKSTRVAPDKDNWRRLHPRKNMVTTKRSQNNSKM